MQKAQYDKVVKEPKLTVGMMHMRMPSEARGKAWKLAMTFSWLSQNCEPAADSY